MALDDAKRYWPLPLQFLQTLQQNVTENAVEKRSKKSNIIRWVKRYGRQTCWQKPLPKCLNVPFPL